MLPDIRAVFGTIVAAIGLLMIAFGVVATYRVAQQNQSGPLQAEMRRGRDVQLASATQRPVLVVETPGPHLAPVATPLAANPVPLVEVAAAIAPPALALLPITRPADVTPAELPIGGPLAQPPTGTPVAALPETSRDTAAENPTHLDARALQRAAAAAKAKARAARIARERRAAARRAAQARRAQEQAARTAAPFGFGANTAFGGTNPFGGTFTTPRE